MTSQSYFGKMNTTLGSVVPLAMFTKRIGFQDMAAYDMFVVVPSKKNRRVKSFPQNNKNLIIACLFSRFGENLGM